MIDILGGQDLVQVGGPEVNKEAAAVALGDADVVVQVNDIQVPLPLGQGQGEAGQPPPLDKGLDDLTHDASQHYLPITSLRVGLRTGLVLRQRKGKKRGREMTKKRMVG